MYLLSHALCSYALGTFWLTDFPACLHVLKETCYFFMVIARKLHGDFRSIFAFVLCNGLVATSFLKDIPNILCWIILPWKCVKWSTIFVKRTKNCNPGVWELQNIIRHRPACWKIKWFVDSIIDWGFLRKIQKMLFSPKMFESRNQWYHQKVLLMVMSVCFDRFFPVSVSHPWWQNLPSVLS
jgi:hypothetical protein